MGMSLLSCGRIDLLLQETVYLLRCEVARARSRTYVQCDAGGEIIESLFLQKNNTK